MCKYKRGDNGSRRVGSSFSIATVALVADMQNCTDDKIEESLVSTHTHTQMSAS